MTTTIALRDYQEAAITAVLDAQQRGNNRGLIALPPGSGKTVIFVSLIRRLGGRALRARASRRIARPGPRQAVRAGRRSHDRRRAGAAQRVRRRCAGRIGADTGAITPPRPTSARSVRRHRRRVPPRCGADLARDPRPRSRRRARWPAPDRHHGEPGSRRWSWPRPALWR